jgi:sorbitol-specific phosphotransferase system component IIC
MIPTLILAFLLITLAVLSFMGRTKLERWLSRIGLLMILTWLAVAISRFDAPEYPAVMPHHGHQNAF